MYKKPTIQNLAAQAFDLNGIYIDILRLDAVHPVVSGNKWYKLKYYLEDAATNGYAGLLSYGGAFSNHLVAMATACAERGMRSLGVIRGERPEALNPSLQDMLAAGMELRFVSRGDYRNKSDLYDSLKGNYPDLLAVPEGGGGEPGVRGASEILEGVAEGYTHVVCAVGTGTTLAGIARALRPGQRAVGISALKIPENDKRLPAEVARMSGSENFTIFTGYHFGGYARHTPALLSFMNGFFAETGVPTDFVYTGKLFFALRDLLSKKQFPPGSRILVVHSGGLQGNRSLGSGVLDF